MKKRCLLKTGPLSILLIFLQISLFGQVNTWFGGEGNWVDGTKWSTGNVPTATSEVSIPSGRVIVSTPGTTATSVYVATGAQLDIFPNGVLDLVGTTPRMRIFGTLTHSGTLNMTGEYNTNIELQGTINSNGLIRIESTVPQQLGNYQYAVNITQGGNYTNQFGGSLTTIGAYNGIFLSGLNNFFTNSGTISISMPNAYDDLIQFQRVAGQGISVSSDAIFNMFSGTLTINGGGRGISLYRDAAFTNGGTIQIGNLSKAVSGVELRDGCSFVNGNFATLEINNLTEVGDQTKNRAIVVEQAGSSFDNQGTLTIGNIGPINDDGVNVLPTCFFTNGTNASVEINRIVDHHAFFLTGAATVNNRGSLKIGNEANVGRSGIYVDNFTNFTNFSTGSVEIDRVPLYSDDVLNAALMPKGGGVFTNQGMVKIGMLAAVVNGIGNQYCNGGDVINTGTIILDKITNYGIQNAQNVVNASGGTIHILATGACRIAGKLTNNGTVNNDGLVTVYIDGLSEFINNGTFNNVGSFSSTALLKGTGTIMPNNSFTLSSSSKLQPGNSPGTLTFQGNLNLGSTEYTCEIGGTTTGTYDVLAISGNATLSNATLNVNWGSFTPVIGNTFTILTCGSRTGQFATVSIPSVLGLVFNVQYNATSVVIRVQGPPAPVIQSAQDGPWATGSTWVGGVVPTSTDDVVIRHPVTNYNGTANCNNLTINADASLVQRARLIVDGDVTINGTFVSNPFGDFGGGNLKTEIGASTTSSPAGTRLVTVNGNLTIGTGSGLGDGVYLAGRIVFNTGSTLNISANNTSLVLTGWSGGTPQYLMDIDNLTTLNLGTNGGIQVPNGNDNQPVISTGRNFIGTLCSPFRQYTPFQLATSQSYNFGNGSGTRQTIASISLGTNTTLNLNNTLVRQLQGFNNGVNITSTGSQFSLVRLGGQNVTLNGDLTLVDQCNGAYPEFSSVYLPTFGTGSSLNVNVTDSALFYIRQGASFQVIPTINMQSGRLVVKGGILDLRTTILTGSNNVRYIITNAGDVPWSSVATLGQNLVANIPLKFDVGVSIPNGANPPTTAYTPLSITASTNAYISMNALPFTPPSTFNGPKAKWEMYSEAVSSSLTFTWQGTIETSSFDRNSAKVYRYNGSAWVELPSSAVSSSADGFSITANNVTTFGVFAVMSPAISCGVPQNIAPQTLGALTASFTWTASSGAASYEVEYQQTVGGSSTFTGTTNTPSVTFTNLTPTGVYLMRVRTDCGSNGYSAWSNYLRFETTVIPTIQSFQTGDWNATSTWVGNVVPTVNENVLINPSHVVSITTATGSECRDLTVQGTIDNSNTAGRYLRCTGNMTITATGFYNGGSDFVSAGYGQYSGGGVLAVGANKAYQGSSEGASSPANNKIVSVNGGRFDGYLVLGGRMTATNSATANLKGGDFTGWLDPDPTPRSIIDADNTSTVTLAGGEFILAPNATSHFPSNVIITSATPTCPSGATFKTYKNGGNYSFGALDRDQTMQTFATLGNAPDFLAFARLKVGNLQFFTSGTTPKTILSAGSKFNAMSLFGAPLTLTGDFELINGCSGNAPGIVMSNNVTPNPLSFSLTVNATDSAIIDLGQLTSTQTFNPPSFTITHGQVVVKGGTLDLRGATVNGLSNTNYFITKPNFNGTKMGKVLLPALGATPVIFNLGIGIPNGNLPPTPVYAPVNIVSNSGNRNVSINLEPLTVPAGYVAPIVQWNITPTDPANPSNTTHNMTITLTWPPSTESSSFAVNRTRAKIYHYNSSTMMWELLVTSALVINPDGSFSLTATNVTNFSPFAVLIPESALAAELIGFSVKQQGEKAAINWQTANEIAVKNFAVEKSLDAKIFSKIAEVKANNTPSVYQAFDDQFTASAYYRLAINDLDGTSRYSKTVFLEKDSDKSIKIRRNTEGSLWVETNDKIESVTVSNSIGQVVIMSKESRLSLMDLPKGIYIVSVKTDKAFVSEKVFNF